MSKQPISTLCECQSKISNIKIAYFDSVRMSKQDFECQITLVRLSANVKMGSRTSKQPISTQCECQNRISNVKIAFFDALRMSKLDFECQTYIFRLTTNVEIGFQLSKQHILTQCECQIRIFNVKKPVSTQCERQNRISNVRIDFFDLVRMSKQDFECQNSLFPLSANVKIGFRMSEQPAFVLSLNWQF